MLISEDKLGLHKSMRLLCKWSPDHKCLQCMYIIACLCISSGCVRKFFQTVVLM